MSSDPLRVCIFAENRHNVFSGGRYHSWHMAEALAARGHVAHYVTNNIPVFYDEFRGAPGHEDVKVHISKEFLTNIPTGPLDVVVVTPGRSDNPLFYRSAKMLALSAGAQLVLINFEAGNWFNSMAPIQRDLSDWDHWKRVVSAGGLVLSSAHESDRWAREFYNEYSDDRLDFDVWSPPINSTAADSVSWHEKEDRVVIISRLADPHKGFQTVLNALPDNIAGWTLAVMTGSSVEPAFETDLRAMAAAKGINLELIMRPSDREKFDELKRAKLMLFPSLFEGYGYPPIEALYCNTDVVSYDLPVVRETCGGLAIYVPHGDEDGFRDAISNALNDPMLGQRDYHSQMFGLGNLMPAAERLEKVFGRYKNPANRKTGRFDGGKVSQLDTEGRIATARQSVTPGWAKQVRRIASLRDPAKWRPAGKKVVSLAGRLLNQLEPKHGVSSATIDQFGVISIRGWYLGPQRPTGIRVQVGDDIEADMEMGQRRPDIQKKFPQYGEPNPGFQVLLRFVDRDLTDAPYKIYVDVKDEVVAVIEGHLSPADKTNLKQVSRLPARKRDIRGKSVAVIAEFDDVRSTTAQRAYLDNLLICLRDLEAVTHLILQGNPSDILPFEQDFAAFADEVIIADVVKPAIEQEVFDDQKKVASATLETLAALQNRQVLMGAVSVGKDMNPALDVCGNGVLKCCLVWSPTLKEGSEGEFESADVLITPNATVSGYMKKRAPHAEHICLPLLAEAFPGHVGLGPAEAKVILIPDCDFEGATESTIDFIVSVSREIPEACFNVLGELGDNVTSSILQDDNLAHLTNCVTGLGLLHDDAEAYANAGMVALPYQPVLEDESSIDGWLDLESNLIRSIASERPVVALPEVANAFNTSHIELVVTATSGASLGLRAAELLQSPSLLKHYVDEGRAFRHSRLQAKCEARSLEAILKRPPFPAQRILSAELDERSASLFKPLLENNSLLPANEDVDLFIGHDVSLGQAALSLLGKRACRINQVCSFSRDFQGLQFSGHVLAMPDRATVRSAVIAAYEEHEAVDIVNRCAALGYRNIVSASNVPDQRDWRETEKLRGLALNGEVHILCGLADTDTLALREIANGHFWIATDVFALKHQSQPILQNLNVIACGNPIVSHKTPTLLSALHPQGIVVTTDQDPTPIGATNGTLVRVESDFLPWFAPPNLRNHHPYRFSEDNDRESLRIAVGLAVWSGANSIIIHGAPMFVDPDTGRTGIQRETGWTHLFERQDYLDFAADHGCRISFHDALSPVGVGIENG